MDSSVLVLFHFGSVSLSTAFMYFGLTSRTDIAYWLVIPQSINKKGNLLKHSRQINIIQLRARITKDA
jgi:hypothetical protein